MSRASIFALVFLLLAGLVAAPGLSMAMGEPMIHGATMMQDGHSAHHHGAATNNHAAPAPMALIHHAKAMIACSAWCAGAFLTWLPATSAWAPVLKFAHDRPALAPALTGLAPCPPLEPPRSLLS